MSGRGDFLFPTPFSIMMPSFLWKLLPQSPANCTILIQNESPHSWPVADWEVAWSCLEAVVPCEDDAGRHISAIEVRSIDVVNYCVSTCPRRPSSIPPLAFDPTCPWPVVPLGHRGSPCAIDTTSSSISSPKSGPR